MTIKTEKMKTFPVGAKQEIFDHETLNNHSELVLCEGEFDKLVLEAHGIPAITFTGGASTFKTEWKEYIAELVQAKKLTKITVLYDNDKAGKAGAEKAVQILLEIKGLGVHKIDLPEMSNGHKDVTDFLVYEKRTIKDLFSYSKNMLPTIDTNQFKPLSIIELINILGATIKKDENNKLITCLTMLTAYTEDGQLNISFNAPSATGKSFLPQEVAKLFPKEDVMEIAYASPNAFFHEEGSHDKEKNERVIDLSRKILIFLDQPHNQLLERLRPMLSHDKKRLKSKITDKSERGGNKTKTIILVGYPVVIFCTAGLNIDEQESTRFVLLSPETSQEKIREAILEKIKKESDAYSYSSLIESNPERILLKERIKAIKQENINDVLILNSSLVEELFFKNNKKLKPRHQRDIAKFMSLIKALALLNCWFREKDDNCIFASDNDIKEAYTIWQEVSQSQELNLPPYIHNIFKEVISPAYEEKQRKYNLEEYGLTRPEVLKKYFDVYGRPLQDATLRQQILLMLENAGLIYQEPSKKDRRLKLIHIIEYSKTS